MKNIFLLAFILLCGSCKKVKQTSDELYSRHLQRKVKLHILHTPPPDDRTLFNLLILNDGQDMGKLKPLVIIAVEVGVFSGSFWWRDKASEDSRYSDEKIVSCMPK